MRGCVLDCKDPGIDNNKANLHGAGHSKSVTFDILQKGIGSSRQNSMATHLTHTLIKPSH